MHSIQIEIPDYLFTSVLPWFNKYGGYCAKCAQYVILNTNR